MYRYLFFLSLGLVVLNGCKSNSSEMKTPSGYKFVKFASNEGPNPQVGEYVFFHVAMSNGDSITYDSRTQPNMPRTTIPDMTATNPRQVNPVTEALAMSAVGDSFVLYYPIDSLGGRIPPGYEGAQFIEYHVAVKDIKSQEQFAAIQAEEQEKAQARLEAVRVVAVEQLEKYKAGQLGDALQTTASGLKYVVLEEGTGKVPEANKNVRAHYFGMLMDGTEFDSSYGRGPEFTFPLGQGRVIKGWDEGFGLFKEGTKAMLFIPSELGYGAEGFGPIPANAELAFYVELVKAD